MSVKDSERYTHIAALVVASICVVLAIMHSAFHVALDDTTVHVLAFAAAVVFVPIVGSFKWGSIEIKRIEDKVKEQDRSIDKQQEQINKQQEQINKQQEQINGQQDMMNALVTLNADFTHPLDTLLSLYDARSRTNGSFKYDGSDELKDHINQLYAAGLITKGSKDLSEDADLAKLDLLTPRGTKLVQSALALKQRASQL
jgi:TolA-binding protein